jgi:hypothetical protein
VTTEPDSSPGRCPCEPWDRALRLQEPPSRHRCHVRPRGARAYSRACRHALRTVYAISRSSSTTREHVGGCAPTRLGRCGFVSETTSGAPTCLEGISFSSFDAALTRSLGSARTKVAACFRLRLGALGVGSTVGAIWVTVPCSAGVGTGTSTKKQRWKRRCV